MYFLLENKQAEVLYKTHSLLPVWAQALVIVSIALIGLLIGVLTAVYLLKKYLKENNPLSEKNIKAIGKQLTGRELSEKQVRRIIQAMKEAELKRKKEKEKQAKKQAKKLAKNNNKKTKDVK